MCVCFSYTLCFAYSVFVTNEGVINNNNKTLDLDAVRPHSGILLLNILIIILFSGSHQSSGGSQYDSTVAA